MKSLFKYIVFFSISFNFFALAMTPEQSAQLDKAKVDLASSNTTLQKKGADSLKDLALKGIPEAQFGLGLMYYKGTGVNKDQNEAIKWYEKAAKENYWPANHLLSVLYRNGCGVKTDASQGQKLLERSKKSASKEELKSIESMEAAVGAKGCSALGLSENKSKLSSIKLLPYKNYKFKSKWDVDNRKKCPKEHLNPNDPVQAFIDPKMYNVEIWCQCYLANLSQAPKTEDLDQMIEEGQFFFDGCLKEAKRK